MTVSLKSHALHGKSKAVLAEALKSDATKVIFYDPSIFPGSRGVFEGESMKRGDSFALCMDPATRRRFAKVTRKLDGSFKVE